MTDYSWIKPGVKVRIKTVEEIREIYGSRMPFGLTAHMREFCGTEQIVCRVDGASPSFGDRCKLAIFLVHPADYMWPEDALARCKTKLGNEI